MGRMRIKKKDTVTPFRQTAFYRLIWLVVAAGLFLYGFYEVIMTVRQNDTIAFLIAVAFTLGSGFAIFFNLDRLNSARMPNRAARKSQRR